MTNVRRLSQETTLDLLRDLAAFEFSQREHDDGRTAALHAFCDLKRRARVLLEIVDPRVKVKLTPMKTRKKGKRS